MLQKYVNWKVLALTLAIQQKIYANKSVRGSFGGDLKCSPFHTRMICILHCTAPPANCLPSLSTTLRECRNAMDFLTLVKLRYFYALSFRSASSVVARALSPLHGCGGRCAEGQMITMS